MDQLAGDEPALTPERIEAAISRAKNDLVSPRGAEEPRPGREGRPDRQGLRGLRGEAARVVGRRFRRPPGPRRVDPQGPPRRPGGPRPPVSYVLVDEYQDTNLAQYAIVRALSVDHPEPLRHGRPRPVDLRLARGQPGEHPRIREGLPRLPGRQARAELPQHEEHPQRRRSPDPVQPQAQAEVAAHREPAGARRSS